MRYFLMLVFILATLPAIAQEATPVEEEPAPTLVQNVVCAMKDVQMKMENGALKRFLKCHPVGSRGSVIPTREHPQWYIVEASQEGAEMWNMIVRLHTPWVMGTTQAPLSLVRLNYSLSPDSEVGVITGVISRYSLPYEETMLDREHLFP